MKARIAVVAGDGIGHLARVLGATGAGGHDQVRATEAAQRFAAWLASGKVDQKRIDASEMLRAITAHIAGGVIPLNVSYEFSHTFAWEEARRRIEMACDLAAHANR